MTKSDTNWEKELEEIRSADQSIYFAKLLDNNPEEIPLVIQAMQNVKATIAWRAGWVLDHFDRQNKSALLPYFRQLSEILLQTPHHGVQRHITRILCNAPASELEDGRLVDACFTWLLNPKTPVAVKANAMEIIGNLCAIYPELGQELKTVIQEGYENGTAAFKSRSQKILIKLYGKKIQPF
ncbi:hypothetical protein [Geofilum rubicundum]|uniref:HEAT repeat domain-containing protein n=1 Tax=Geofilum rubicundum JCM 15548 TaxID=1236989 RepID=A0A0E9LU74_9BACT|nr:hypothetical protein [Geofilum rubicundum]GAO28686.1 hypothetical protein JCM15548_1809 [Geofilum rubicundum JCM 15548]